MLDERLERELDTFAFALSHEFRAPLRHIDWFAQSILTQHTDTLPATVVERLGHVLSAANRLSRMIEDLLLWHRAGHEQLRRRPIDTRKLVARSLVEMRRRYSHLSFRVELGDLPTVNADPAQLARLFNALLDNAVKCSAGAGEATIRIGCPCAGKPPADPPVFHVADNGIGFDMAQRTSLFIPFQHLHAAHEYPDAGNGHGAGTGIGLAMAETIVARHGGWIIGEGKPGEGACFRFTLAEGPSRR